LSQVYQKALGQLRKERARRRRLRAIVLTYPKPEELTQIKLAEMLGCSQATVSRDLAKLGSSRWHPFRELRRRKFDAMYAPAVKRYVEWEETRQFLRSLRLEDQLAYFRRFVRSLRAPKATGKPRGKAFSRDYQPRWKRWGRQSFHCTHCGRDGAVEVTGRWRRGETKVVTCPQCGGSVGIRRPDLPTEARRFIAPCGFEGVITTKGRWPTRLPLVFTCPKCGEEHIVRKRDTQRYPT
jgi:transcription elongation factor Elf1